MQAKNTFLKIPLFFNNQLFLIHLSKFFANSSGYWLTKWITENKYQINQ